MMLLNKFRKIRINISLIIFPSYSFLSGMPILYMLWFLYIGRMDSICCHWSSVYFQQYLSLFVFQVNNVWCLCLALGGMGVHVFVCMCMWLQRLTMGIFLNYSPPYCFGSRVSHRTWSSQIRVGWVSSELQGSTCLYHPSAEIASLYWLFTWVLEIQTHVRMLAQENFLSCLLSSHPMNHFSCLQAWCPFLSCTRSSTGLAQQCINVSALKRPFGFFKNISKSCL